MSKEIVFKTPPVAPINGTIPTTDTFKSARVGGIHGGIDIPVPKGTQVFSVDDGRVLESNPSLGDCGGAVIIEYDGYTVKYCHLSFLNFGIIPRQKPGKIPQGYYTPYPVRAGELVGLSGNTGHVSTFGNGGYHLHIEVRNDKNELIDPEPLLFTKQSKLRPINVGGKDIADNKLISPKNDYKGELSPFIDSMDSFHPKIQYELTRRRFSLETVDTYIPFVKLTSLMRVKDSNLPKENNTTTLAYYPSLGVHGKGKISFDDIYRPQQKNSIVGYAIDASNPNNTVPVLVENSQNDPENIPIPGIVDVKLDRNLAGAMGVHGGLIRGKLNIVAYSIGQLNTLIKYFLRPSINLVLEVGHMSSNPANNITPFNWNRKHDIISKIFDDFIKGRVSQRKFIKQYVYDNFGRYEIFICTVIKFNIKITKDNLYQIELDVQSTQQFEIPNALSGVRSNCGEASVDKCKSIDTNQYFNPNTENKQNTLKELMRLVLAEDTGENPFYYRRWAGHVIKPKLSDDKDIDGTKVKSPDQSSLDMGKGLDGYFVTWRFFVEVILNDPYAGLLSVFPNNNDLRDFVRTGLLAKHTTKWNDTPKQGLKDENIPRSTSLISNEVGYHPELRSTNPDVMIIYNTKSKIEKNEYDFIMDKENAARIQLTPDMSGAERDYTTSLKAAFRELQTTNDGQNDFEKKITNHPGGGFDTGTEDGKESEPNSSFLTNGIWINTNAIIRSFMNTDTVASAIQSLLQEMNNATLSYWNLQLLSNDINSAGLHVIDHGLSKNHPKLLKSSDTSTAKSISSLIDPLYSNLNVSYFTEGEDTPKYIYMFNKKLRVNDNEAIGGDLLNLNVEFNLPQMIAVQAIAGIGGIAEKGTLELLDTVELEQLSVIPKLESCEDATKKLNTSPCPEKNETLNLLPELKNNPWFKHDFKKDNMVILKGIRDYAKFGTSIRHIELDASVMLKALHTHVKDTVGKELEANKTPTAHAFNSSNLTKTTATVTLPGIGGISLLQSFYIDRIPLILKKGFYIVTNINHTFSVQSGWVTQLTGRFRWYPNINRE